MDSTSPARLPGSPRLALALVLVIAAAAAACTGGAGSSATPASSGDPTAPPTATPGPTTSPADAGGPLVSVELRGGHCVDGACGSTVVLHTDGVVRTAGDAPSELGTVPDEDVAGLSGLIGQADFDAIRAVPFTGTCPMAFDGQEVVLEFTTADGVERIESCTTTVDLGHPLFAAVAGVMADFIQIPEY